MLLSENRQQSYKKKGKHLVKFIMCKKCAKCQSYPLKKNTET